ncbi:unannotated protein [freshwater metagenome]|uniref:Unannotated protein n=1 Tax=freshwater metagenome TaxID=449393 RepID=A0A6J6J6B9_9ZZZZ
MLPSGIYPEDLPIYLFLRLAQCSCQKPRCQQILIFQLEIQSRVRQLLNHLVKLFRRNLSTLPESSPVIVYLSRLDLDRLKQITLTPSTRQGLLLNRSVLKLAFSRQHRLDFTQVVPLKFQCNTLERKSLSATPASSTQG